MIIIYKGFTCGVIIFIMSKVTSYPADYQTFPTLFELEPVAGKKVTVDFSAPELSSLGGLTLVREYEKSSSSIIERIESCIKDPRWEPMVIHSQTEMLRQRIYQIMAGFEDADDCDRLCGDGILKMCAGRSASDEIDLASQPTMTRLENRLSRKELFDIGEAFIDDFIASYNSEPDSIIIDADDTNADTYGAQQLTLFNAYYGEYCYMPLLLFEGRSGKLILPVLRLGRGNKAINIAGLLKRMILKLRKKWKHTQIIVRGDSHFCSHDFMDWATDRQDGIHFITGLAGNVKLKRKSANWLDTAIASYEATGEEVRIFHSFMYKASSWKHQQRVVVKIEVNNLGTNVRYVVTDFKGQRSSFIYSDCYCDRGRMEQMISELKNGLKADRMSCNKFTANQFRLYLHCAAYVILHSFQADMLAGTELECSTITTMREKLLLSAVSIDEKKTCIRIRFSQKAPMLPEMVSVLTRLRHLPPS